MTRITRGCLQRPVTWTLLELELKSCSCAKIEAQVLIICYSVMATANMLAILFPKAFCVSGSEGAGQAGTPGWPS